MNSEERSRVVEVAEIKTLLRDRAATSTRGSL